MSTALIVCPVLNSVTNLNMLWWNNDVHTCCSDECWQFEIRINLDLLLLMSASRLLASCSIVASRYLYQKTFGLLCCTVEPEIILLSNNINVDGWNWFHLRWHSPLQASTVPRPFFTKRNFLCVIQAHLKIHTQPCNNLSGPLCKHKGIHIHA